MNFKWKEKKDNFEKDGKVYLVRCPECGRENYMFNVSSGACTWCSYSVHDEEDKNAS